MNTKTIRLLFLCTGNSCRSIMAECIANSLGGGGIVACSAGSAPAGYVHLGSLECLARHGMTAENPRSKSWDEFAGQPFDLVVTVCERAAGEACPLLAGPALKTHWGTPDPAAARGNDAEIAAAFDKAFVLLREPIQQLIEQIQDTDNTSDLDTIIRSMNESFS
jgi:arsenate reductase